jgi:Rrf2 family protein
VRSGILQAASGPRGGYRLARPATTITVLDVVEAIDGTARPFLCQEIRQRGLAAAKPKDCLRPCTVDAIMTKAHQSWRASLRESTIADIVAKTPAAIRRRNAERLQQAARPTG